jgi:hypothetical protein
VVRLGDTAISVFEDSCLHPGRAHGLVPITIVASSPDYPSGLILVEVPAGRTDS